jgi:hypothetical protein
MTTALGSGVSRQASRQVRRSRLSNRRQRPTGHLHHDPPLHLASPFSRDAAGSTPERKLPPTFRTVSSVKSGRFVRSGLITRSMTEGNPIENVLSIDNRRTKSSGLTDDLHRRWERPVGGERSRWDGISRWIRTLEVAQRRSSTRIGKWRTRLPVA